MKKDLLETSDDKDIYKKLEIVKCKSWGTERFKRLTNGVLKIAALGAKNF